jgi:hypothetical protein
VSVCCFELWCELGVPPATARFRNLALKVLIRRRLSVVQRVRPNPTETEFPPNCKRVSALHSIPEFESENSRNQPKNGTVAWGEIFMTAVLVGLATWLILPVVICLSQRLSHAGLSISQNKVKPRMAHYISYGSLDLRYLTWITLEILELIHAKVVPSLVRGTFLLDQNQSGSNLCPFGESEQL